MIKTVAPTMVAMGAMIATRMGTQPGIAFSVLFLSEERQPYLPGFRAARLDEKPGSADSLARFSTPESNRDRVIPSAPEIFARLRKLKLVSPRSIVPMKVL